MTARNVAFCCQIVHGGGNAVAAAIDAAAAAAAAAEASKALGFVGAWGWIKGDAVQSSDVMSTPHNSRRIFGNSDDDDDGHDHGNDNDENDDNDDDYADDHDDGDDGDDDDDDDDDYGDDDDDGDERSSPLAKQLAFECVLAAAPPSFHSSLHTQVPFGTTRSSCHSPCKNSVLHEVGDNHPPFLCVMFLRLPSSLRLAAVTNNITLHDNTVSSKSAIESRVAGAYDQLMRITNVSAESLASCMIMYQFFDSRALVYAEALPIGACQSRNPSSPKPKLCRR